MSVQKPIGDPKALQRPIPSAPRYQRVEAVVDTGMSVPLAQLAKSQGVSIKQGKDELFRRTRPSTIASMIEQLRLLASLNERGSGDVPPTPLPEHRDLIARQAAAAGTQQAPPATPLSASGPSSPTQQKKGKPPRPEITGKIGRKEAESVTPRDEGDPAPIPLAQRRLLLLDVREREEYEACHIVSAHHFPPARLSHATNPFTGEILSYRNKPDCVIVLYDLEEDITVGLRVGNIFFEKGIDNVYVMAGGLRAFVQDHVHLCTGPSPVPILEKSQRLTIAKESTERLSKLGSLDGSQRGTPTRPKPLASSLSRPDGSVGVWK